MKYEINDYYLTFTPPPFMVMYRASSGATLEYGSYATLEDAAAGEESANRHYERVWLVKTIQVEKVTTYREK